MKKCPWCGKEYPDATLRCPTDGEALPGQEPPPAPETQGSLLPVIPPAPARDPVAPPGPTRLTDRQLRIIELVLVVAVAFGGSILASTFYFLGLEPTAPLGSHLMWADGVVLESAALALVWYVLRRRFKTFHDLGLSPSGKDILWSIILYIAGTLGFYLVYSVIQLAGLTTVTGTTATARVTTTLFGGGFSPLAILFLIVNPAFEEVTVRGYVMTEIRHLTGSAWKAATFSTLLQMSYHFYQGAPLAFSAGATFAIFSVYYAKTNRLAAVILAHFYMDWFAVLWFMFQR